MGRDNFPQGKSFRTLLGGGKIEWKNFGEEFLEKFQKDLKNGKNLKKFLEKFEKKLKKGKNLKIFWKKFQ